MISCNEKVYRYLREKMLAGELTSGTKLVDTELAKDIGVSRTPVREAVIRLTGEGFCKQVPGIGTFVKELDKQELEDLFELRVVLESHAAMRAAIRADRQKVLELEALCAEMRDCAHEYRKYKLEEHPPKELTRRFSLADIKFHLTVVRMSGNQQIVKVFENMAIMSRLCSYASGSGYCPIWRVEHRSMLKDIAITYHRHYQIFHAIERGDPKAAKDGVITHLVPMSPQGGKVRLAIAHRMARKQRSDSVREEFIQVLRDMEKSSAEENLLNQ